MLANHEPINAGGIVWCGRTARTRLAIARTHGRAVLRECCGRDVMDDTVDMLIDATLELLAKVVRAELN